MDDFQFILYIIFAIIYFLSRGLKKKKPVTRRPAPRKPQGASPAESAPGKKPQRGRTFEDILREISREFEGKEEPEPQRPAPVPSPQPDYQSVYEDDDEIIKNYEESVIKAEKAQTLDERIDLENLEFKRLEVYRVKDDEKPVVELDELIDELSEKNGLAKAVLYREILDRRY